MHPALFVQLAKIRAHELAREASRQRIHPPDTIGSSQGSAADALSDDRWGDSLAPPR